MNQEVQHNNKHMAAIDLGSNSFHMLVARIEDGHLHILDSLKEMVRLGAGLNEHGLLSEEVQERALYCLERFGERVRDLPRNCVAAVGTNTLRKAKNAREFLKLAAKALGHPISVIGGREEARLIYLGVSHSLVDEDGKRFIMDIGGGSTELIIGEDFEPLHLRSLSMGCVSMSRKFFDGGKLNQKCWKQAGIEAHLRLRPERLYFQEAGWKSATGASGTIKSVDRVVKALNLEQYDITLGSLYKIRDMMIEAGHLDRLQLPGLKDERRDIFAGGLAVLIAVFEALKIKNMQVSDGALREGLLYERIGRIRSEDTRLKTISSVQQRFQISTKHARRVSKTAHWLLVACEERWNLALEDAELLHWACSLHEIGLAVSLSGYQKHGAYLIDHADMPGFSFEEQDRMSQLVRCHRKKISYKLFKEVDQDELKKTIRLIVLIRLATLLHRSRKDETLRFAAIVPGDNGLCLEFAPGELRNHPLQLASLEQEAGYLKSVDFELNFY